MKQNLIRATVILAALLIWELVGASGLLSPRVLPLLPPPSAIIGAATELMFVGLPPGKTLPMHIWSSMIRVFYGFMLAAAVAIPLGIAMGWSSRLRTLCEPFIQVLRPIPPLAWIPIAVLWFGLGLKSQSFIIFLGVFFPVLVSTVSGVDSVDQVTIKAARTLGAKDKDILLKVLTPAAMPFIITGLRVGLGIGWMSLVAAEFVGVENDYGLGYMIMFARDIFRTDAILAGMLIIGFVGYFMDSILRIMERRLLQWRE